ncbi:MAG: HAD-IA family hydrolase, partial [Verrucomicrobiota bacterium]
VGHTYSRVARAHGIEADETALTKAFGTVWKRTPPAFSGSPATSDLNERDWWRELVREVFTEAGAASASTNQFDLFFDVLYRHYELPGTWIADPDAQTTLELVSRNYPCALLSNFDRRLLSILDHFDLLHYFHHRILSCEVKASKPDPKIYAVACEALGVPPSHILHVGDDPVCDWDGARNAGFQVFRVERDRRRLGELLSELSLA